MLLTHFPHGISNYCCKKLFSPSVPTARDTFSFRGWEVFVPLSSCSGPESGKEELIEIEASGLAEAKLKAKLDYKRQLRAHQHAQP
jgi:hypothetical protein